MDGLTVGRTVRYMPPERQSEVFALESGPLAAIVARVRDGARGVATLSVVRTIGSPVAVDNVPYSEQKLPNTWHWPPQGA